MALVKLSGSQKKAKRHKKGTLWEEGVHDRGGRGRGEEGFERNQNALDICMKLSRAQLIKMDSVSTVIQFFNKTPLKQKIANTCKTPTKEISKIW